MAVVADKVLVELEARLDKYQSDILRAESKFDQAMSGIQKSASSTEGIVRRAAGGMGSALAGVSVVALAQGFLKLADESKKLDASLKLATRTSGSFGKAQEDVRRIAEVTRSGLSDTAALYGNFVRNSQALGATQADAARATETFSKTLKISGASAAEAGSATLQFSQALASGALRGDELNSILEASPRLAKLLADSLGITVGQLRTLGAEGALTSDKLLKALTDKKFTAGIDSEFKQLPVTFDDAMTRVSNAAIIAFGAFDRGGEFSTTLANFISDGAEGFADLEKSAEDFGISVRGTLGGLADAFGPLVDAGKAAFEALGIEAGNFSFSGRKEIQSLLDSLDELDKKFGFEGYTAFGKKVSGVGQRFRESAEAADRRRSGEAAERRFQATISGYDLLGNPTGGGKSSRPTPTASPKKGAKGKTDKSRSFDLQMGDLTLRIEAAARDVPNDVDFINRGTGGYTPDAVVDPIETRKNAEFEVNQQIAEDMRRRQENQIRSAAALYEDLFRGGTKAIWGDFKQIGFQIIAQVLAQFTVSRVNGSGFDFGSALSGAFTSVLGFAGGGSGTLGGRGGTDTNVLSLNGRPIANVTRGEPISIGSKAYRPGSRGGSGNSYTIHIDASNSVNPDGFERRLTSTILTQAARMDAQASRGTLQAVPARLARFQNDGT